MTDVTIHHVKPAERVYDTIFSAFQQQSVSTLSIESLFGRFSADASLRHYAGKNPSGLCEYIRKNLANRFAVSDDGQVVTSFAMQKQLALQSIGQRTKEEELASLGKSWSATSMASSTASKPGAPPQMEPFEETDIRERVYGLIYTAFMKKNTAVLSCRQIFGYFHAEHDCREEVGGNCTGLVRYIGQNFAQSYVLSGQVGNEVVTSIPMKHYLTLHPDFKESHSPASEDPVVLNNSVVPSKNQIKKQQDEAMEERMLRNEGDDGYDISAEQAVVNAICAIFEAYRRNQGRDTRSCPPLSLNQLHPHVMSLLRSHAHHVAYFGGRDKRALAAFVQQRTHLFSVDVIRNGQKVEHTVHRRMAWEAETMVVINSSVRKKSLKPVADLHNLWCHSSRFPDAARTHYGADANGLLKFLKSHAWIFSLVFSDKHVSSRREVVVPQAAEVDRLAEELKIDDLPLVSSETLAFPPKLVAKLSSDANAKAEVSSATTKSAAGAPESAGGGLKAYVSGDGNPFEKNPPKDTSPAKKLPSLKNNDSMLINDSKKSVSGVQAQAKKVLGEGAKSKKSRKLPRAQSEASKVSINSSVSSSVVCPPGFEFCDVPEVSRYSNPPTELLESSIKDRLGSPIKSTASEMPGTNFHSTKSYPTNVSGTGTAFCNAVFADKVPADPVVDSVTGLEDVLRAFRRLSRREAEQFRQKLPLINGIRDDYATGNSFAMRLSEANSNGQVFGDGGGITGWQTLSNNQHPFDVNRSLGSNLTNTASGLVNMPFVRPSSLANAPNEAGPLANNLAYLPQTQPDGTTILLPIFLNNSNFTITSSAFAAPGVEPTPFVNRGQSTELYAHSSSNVPLGLGFDESTASSNFVSNDSTSNRQNPATSGNLPIPSSSQSLNISRNQVPDFSGDFVTGTNGSSDFCSNCRKIVFPEKSKEVGIQVNKVVHSVDVSTQTVKTGPEILNSLMEANGLAAFMMD